MLGGPRGLEQLKKYKLKGNSFKIIALFFLAVVLGLLVSVYYYNKPHVDVEKSEAAYVLTAQSLIDEYQKDEAVTDKKYSEHVILVKGNILEISTLKGNGVITLNDGDPESSIICHMLPSQNAKTLTLKKGQSINIKGICTGYLLDVIMVRCTIVE